MAKHRKQKQRWAPRAVVVGTTALAVSSTVIAGHVTERLVRDTPADLLAYIYGVGGSNDKEGVNIPAKLNGELIGEDDTYHPIVYPAGIPIDPSVEDGIPTLYCALTDDKCTVADGLPEGESAVVVGYSEGAIVVEYMRRMLQDDPNAPDENHLRFVQIAGPSVPNGGIYARFTSGIIPGFTTTGPSVPTKYDTTYVTIEYDPAADFPAYFNPLAITNSLIAFFPTHPDPSYNAADIDDDPTALIKEVDNPAGGTDTYVFIPVEHLQILWPARLIAETLQLTPYTEPVLGAFEPVLRVFVDMGYTDRENKNPEQHVPFSLITPPEKIVEAVEALPGAVEDGWENFESGIEDLIPTEDQDDADSDETLASTSEAESATETHRDPRPGIRLLRLLRDRDHSEEVQDSASGDATPNAVESPEPEPSDDDIEPEAEDAETQPTSEPSDDTAPAA